MTGSPLRFTQVQARIRALARATGIDANRLYLLYFQEGWLRRVAHSPHRETFVLKGGLLLYARRREVARPTKDIDFLGRGLPDDPDTVVRRLREIAGLDLPDALHFDPDSVRVEPIRDQAEYAGLRAWVTGALGPPAEAQLQVVQFDLGFGDAVVPAAVELAYPQLLADDFARVEALRELRVVAYSLETVVAEKFHAIVFLNVVTSRSKDFYDLYWLSRTESFHAGTLREALLSTFQRRRTPLEDSALVFDAAFLADQTQQDYWTNFLRRDHLSAPPSFAEVMARIRSWLEPVVAGTAQGDWRPDPGTWVE